MELTRRSIKTAVLDILRAPLMSPSLGSVLCRLTEGQPYGGLLAKLTPNRHRYPRPSLRTVTRYGYRFTVDLSDFNGWALYFGFENKSHDQLLEECYLGNVILDVGANIGVTAIRMSAAVGSGGKIYAFEPDPANFSRCAHHVTTNSMTNIEIFQLGLGEISGELVLGFGKPDHCGTKRIVPSGSNGQRIHVTTIDEFVSEKAISRLDLIKIDVEGFEYSVLRGASDTLSKYRPTLFLELDDSLLGDQGASPAQLLSLLDDLGYLVFHSESKQSIEKTPMKNVHIDVVCRPETVLGFPR